MSARYTFARQVRELRFIFSQTGTESSALRTFLTKSYPVMKKHNPDVPILIREAMDVTPKIFARYEFGKEKSETLSGLSEQDIASKVETLVKNAPA